MRNVLLSTAEAAQQLGISRATLYQWLADSDSGTFVIRGELATINYYQSGPHGQGKIQIEATEVNRLIELMRVRPRTTRPRRQPTRRRHYPGITVELGNPGD
jgi:excisionase family DNA binding protein